MNKWEVLSLVAIPALVIDLWVREGGSLVGQMLLGAYRLLGVFVG